MSDIIPVRRKIIKPINSSTSGRTIDDEFDDILTGLNGAEAKKEQAIREELQGNYDNWAYHIRLLKEQFGEVWDLFGKIENKVLGWQRKSQSYGQWGFMGASGYGYNFGALVEYKSQKDYKRKILGVCFGCSFTDKAGNGAGDERDVGRTQDLDDNLIGLENCQDRTLSHQLSGSKYMLEKLDGHELFFLAHNDNIGRQAINTKIGFLYDHRLKEVCQKLFVALNQDEVIDLPKYLPAPKS